VNDTDATECIKKLDFNICSYFCNLPFERITMENLMNYTNTLSSTISKTAGVEQFIVHKNSSQFTEDHLEKHKAVFNPLTQPEYFNYEHLGLEYVHTILMDKEDLNNIAQSGQRQKYRLGMNKSFESIRRDVNEKGIDIRKKMTFVVVDGQGKFIDIFSGNTWASVMEGTSLRNRIVSVFKTNKNFTRSNLIKAGVHQNGLEKPSGEATITDVKYAIQEIINTGEIGFLSKDAGPEDRATYATILVDAIKDMTGKERSYIQDRKQYMDIINDCMNEQLDDKALFSVKNGVDLMKFLNKTSNQYNNSRLVHYTSFSNSFAAKALQSMAGDWINFRDPEKNSPTSPDYFNYEKGLYCVILHGGSPDVVDPIGWFFKKNKDFYDQWIKNLKFIQSDLITGENIGENSRISIYGVFQPIKDLDHILPYLSVVPMDQFFDAYENYYLKGKILNYKSTYGSNTVDSDDSVD